MELVVLEGGGGGGEGVAVDVMKDEWVGERVVQLWMVAPQDEVEVGEQGMALVNVVNVPLCVVTHVAAEQPT